MTFSFNEKVNREVDSFINRLRGALMYRGGDFLEKDFNDISAYKLIDTCFRNNINLTCQLIEKKDKKPWE